MMNAEERAIKDVEQKYHNAELACYPGKSRPGRQRARPRGVPRKPLVLASARNKKKEKVVAHVPVVAPQRAEGPTTVQLLRMQLPDQPHLLGEPRLAADIGSYRTDVIDMKYPWATAVMNGVPGAGDSRYPDPFTLVRTSLLSVVSKAAQSAQNWTTGTYAYSVHGIFKGSPVGTLGFNQHGDDFAGTGMQWNLYNASTAPYGLNWYNCGLGDVNFYTRPNGCVLSIKPLLRGVAHSVQVFAVPVGAARISEHVAQPTGWPTNPVYGLTSAMAAWGGRTWEFNPGDSEIRLVTLPYDARSLDFQPGNSERLAVGSANGVSWSEWIFWMYGLSADDYIEYTVYSLEEAFLATNTTTVYAFPVSPKKADSPGRDGASNLISRVANAGWAALKFASGTLMDLRAAARTIGGMDWASLLPAATGSDRASFPIEGLPVTPERVGPLPEIALPAATRTMVEPTQAKRLPDEEKTDEVVMVTPRIPRPVNNATPPLSMLSNPASRAQH